MADHVLVVTLEPLSADEQTEYDQASAADRKVWDRDRVEATVECSGVDDACRTWQECQKPCEEARGDMDAVDYDEHLSETGESHGIEHQRLDGVWMTPTGRCLGADLDNAWEAAGEAAEDLFDGVPGRCPVDVNCKDGSLIIARISTSART